jgi:DNA-binding CsgD family transcriptional regulator
MRGPIEDAVADVLAQHDVDLARARLAEAILAATGTEVAARVSVGHRRSDALVRIHGEGFRPASEHLASAADVRAHPLPRYRAHTGDRRPKRLEDVVRAGWRIHAATQRSLAALRIPEHQADFVVPSGDDYEGWVLIASARISRSQMRPLIEHGRLLRGLDSHVELLARLRAHGGPAAGADAPLTPRELAVLQLIYAGRTAASIGAQLGVSPRTVHKHQEHLYRTLGACDRLGAVLAGQRSGLLPAAPAGQEAASAHLRAAR